jgi:signal transduction histidine kinase/ActR/RegA family two-component response regulator
VLSTSSHEYVGLFYDSERLLRTAVGDFLSVAAGPDEAALVVTTPEHRDAFREELHRRSIPVDDIEREGRLAFVDARETLDDIFDGAHLDAAEFERALGERLRRVKRPPTGRLRVFSEMVELLSRGGLHETALTLERFWSALGKRLGFSVLCAYSFAGLGDERSDSLLKRRRRTRLVLASLHEETDSDGAPEGLARVAHEPAERRKAEDLRVELAREQEANRLRSEFLATISHELRTPLNAILGWSMLLESQPLDAQTKKSVATIVRNAKAQARLIDDLLDMSRLTRGKVPLQNVRTDLGTIVRDAVDAVRPSAEAKGVRLRTHGLDRPWPLVADPARLQQVAWNLLTNAVKFTETGDAVFVRIDDADGQLVFSVRDTGRGIDPSFLPRVFERFHQADSSIARRTGGLGLGLAIVQQLVELHGGTVEALSPGLGHGSTFRVTLPPERLSGHRPDQARRKAPDETRLDGVTILLVDDEPDAREALAALLSAGGATILEADDATAALAMLDREPPDVVVSDLAMPGMDGFGFIREVRRRAHESGANIPAIALTAHADEAHRKKAREAGFDEFATKPVRLEALVATIGRVLDARSTRP